jgi:hypothetical protein
MEVNPLDISGFLNQTYITPIEERTKFLSLLESIYKEISSKINTSLPRGVVSTSRRTSLKIIDENNEKEINFDDIKLK